VLPVLTPSTLNWTPATATLSVALAVRLAFPDKVAFAAGDVIATLGDVVSVPDVVLPVALPLTTPEQPWLRPEITVNTSTSENPVLFLIIIVRLTGNILAP
jgi:hypothetical protein